MRSPTRVPPASAGEGLAADRRGRLAHERFFAAALPPLRPAAFFWAVVPPCFAFPPEPELLPPRFDAPGELAMRAARSFDMPLSFSASYCFSFFTAISCSSRAGPTPAAHAAGDARRCSLARGSLVHAADRDLRQRLVRRALLVERLLQERGC